MLTKEIRKQWQDSHRVIQISKTQSDTKITSHRSLRETLLTLASQMDSLCHELSAQVTQSLLAMAAATNHRLRDMRLSSSTALTRCSLVHPFGTSSRWSLLHFQGYQLHQTPPSQLAFTTKQHSQPTDQAAKTSCHRFQVPTSSRNVRKSLTN